MNITLPDNCYGLEMAGGKKYDADRRGHVDVPDEHAKRALKANRGLISAPAYRLGTRRGRRCPSCQFLAQAWSDTCPRCGTDTEEEK